MGLALAPPAGYEYIMNGILTKETLRVIFGDTAILSIVAFIKTEEWVEKMIKTRPWLEPTQHGIKMEDFLKPDPEFFMIFISFYRLPNWEPDERYPDAWPMKASTARNIYISRLYENMRDYIDFRGTEYTISKIKLDGHSWQS